MTRTWWSLDPMYSRMTMQDLMASGTHECMTEVYLRICKNATQKALLMFIRTKKPFSQMACDELCARNPSSRTLRRIIRSNAEVAMIPAAMLMARDRVSQTTLDLIVHRVKKLRCVAWYILSWRFPPTPEFVSKMLSRFPELSTPA